MKSLICYLLTLATAWAAPGDLVTQFDATTVPGTSGKFAEARLTPVNGRVLVWNGSGRLANLDIASTYATTSALTTGLADKASFSTGGTFAEDMDFEGDVGVVGTVTSTAGFAGPGSGLTDIPLTSAVTGVLPKANGGTGVTSLGATGEALMQTATQAAAWTALGGGGTIASPSFSGLALTGAMTISPNVTHNLFTLGSKPNRIYASQLRPISIHLTSDDSNGATLFSPSDGVLRLTNFGTTSFSRLQFGGTSSSFGALQTSGTTITAGLADGTAGGSFVASGTLTFSPAASATPASNGQLTFEATSNTSLTVKLKGTDGTVRSVVLTLAP